MMNFKNFFWNVVSAADLIASNDALERKWIHKEKGITSAFDYDELAQQLIDDLEIEKQVERFSDELRNLGAFDETSEFVRRLLEVDELYRKDPTLTKPMNLLKSQEWKTLRTAAERIVSLPAAAALRRDFA